MNYHLSNDPTMGDLDGTAIDKNSDAICNKRQLILNTIEDLKRSLEDQSIELCGLNDDDDA